MFHAERWCRVGIFEGIRFQAVHKQGSDVHMPRQLFDKWRTLRPKMAKNDAAAASESSSASADGNRAPSKLAGVLLLPMETPEECPQPDTFQVGGASSSSEPSKPKDDDVQISTRHFFAAVSGAWADFSTCLGTLNGEKRTALLDWKSQLQKSISLSTAEAEIVAFRDALRKLVGMLEYLEVFFGKLPIEIRCDSSAGLGFFARAF